MKSILKSKKAYMYIGLLLLLFMEQLFVARRFGTARSFTKACLIINALMSAGLLLSLYCMDRKQISLSRLYVLFASFMGLAFMIMLPIYVVPDEPVHILATYSLSNRMLGIADTDSSTWIRVMDHEMPEVVHFENVETYDAYYDRFGASPGDSSLTETGAPRTDAPFYSYLPAAVGLTAGRLLGLNTVMTYMLGRLFNLFVFIAVMGLAIKLLPFGKLTAFIVGLMPMTLQEAASFSYDWFIICMSVLAVALSLNIYKKYKENREISWQEWAALTVTCVLVFTMKGHAYFSISLLPILLIAFHRYPLSGRTKRILKLSGIILLAVMMLYTVYRSVFAQGDLVAVPDNYLEYAETQGYTIQYFINNPSRILIVLFGTIEVYDMNLIEQTVGNQLGWLDISVFRPILYWFMLCLLVSPELEYESETDALERQEKIILLVCGVLSVICIFAGMLLHWTPQDSIAVLGVQGRYFIPTALLFLLPIKGNPWVKVNNSLAKPICVSVMFFLTILVELLLLGVMA